MTPTELAADLRTRINPAYTNQLGTESYERRICAGWKQGQKEDLALQVEMQSEISSLREQVRREQLYNQERGDEIDGLRAALTAALESEAAYKQLCEEAKPFAQSNVELRTKLAEQRMIIFDHEMLHAQILEQRKVIESMQPRTMGNIGTACGEYVECSGRPDAPHGVDVEASFRTGRTVCVCKSWAPGEAS